MKFVRFLAGFALLSWFIHQSYVTGIKAGAQAMYDLENDEEYEDPDIPSWATQGPEWSGDLDEDWPDWDGEWSDEGEPTLFPEKPAPFWPTERVGGWR